MSRPHTAPRSVSDAFNEVCAQLETALNGPLRRHIVGEVAKARDAARAMERLRDSGLDARMVSVDGSCELDLDALRFEREPIRVR